MYPTQSEWVHAAVKSLHENVSLFHMCGETIIKRLSALGGSLEKNHTMTTGYKSLYLMFVYVTALQMTKLYIVGRCYNHG